MPVPVFRFHFGRRLATGALLALAACSDPSLTEAESADAARYRTQQEAAEAEAQAEQARLVEREQAALAIETAPPERIDEEQFYQLLDYHCGDCHVPPDSPWEGLHDFYDLNRLINAGKVIPGNAEASRILLRIRQGDMPPATSEVPPMPDVAIDLIVDFINRLPVADPQAGAEQP